ncbi:MAG: response regulator, partial [Terriglobales bacterium]
MKVLLAEDDSVTRMLLTSALSKRGYDVMPAADGTEAWRHLQGRDAPRLAVLDWIMPGMDGVELCRKLRADESRPYTYVLLLTGRVDKTDILTGLDAGADDYLTKPFDPEELRVRLQVGRRIVETDEQRRQLEEQLRQKQKIEALGALTGGIAHDFNNLIMIISAYSQEMLDQVSKGHPFYAGLEQIHKAGDRAAALVRQMLAFSRKQVLSPRLLDVNATLSETTRMLRRLVGEDIDLSLTLGAETWPVVADPVQMEQVLLNLAANARDAMPRGGKLGLTTRNADLDSEFVSSHLGSRLGPHVVVSVRDSGCGMAPEVQSHIFDPFFTTKDVGKGTGLGLASVYGIVKQSGGYITVESEIGKGTTFEIYLPKAPESMLAKALPKPLEAAESGRVRPFASVIRTQAVLVVEDEEAAREALCSFLKVAGYEAVPAQNGQEALQKCVERSKPFDVVVTDIVMPGGISGPELARQISKLCPQT